MPLASGPNFTSWFHDTRRMPPGHLKPRLGERAARPAALANQTIRYTVSGSIDD